MAKDRNPASQSKKDAAIAQSVAKYIEEQSKASKDLKKSIDEVSDDYSDLANVLQGLVKNAKLFGDEWEDIEDISKTMLKNVENIGSEYYEQVKTAKQFKQIQEKQAKLAEDKKESQTKINDALEIEKKAREKLEKLQKTYQAAQRSGIGAFIDQTKEAVDQQQTYVDGLREIVDDTVKMHQAKLAETELAKENLAYAKEHLIALQEQLNVLDRAHEVAEKMGINLHEISGEIMEPFEKALSFVEGLPGGGIMGKFLGFDKKMEKIQKQVLASFTKGLAETGSVGKSAFKALMTGASSFMTTILPLLPLLITIGAVIALFKMALDVDKETMEMARNLGMSYEAAHNLHHEMAGILLNTENGAMSMEELDKAAISVSKTFGTNAALTKDVLENQVALTKNLGVAEESAAAINQMFTAQGKNLKEGTLEVMSTVQQYNKATGAAMNQNEVFEDIAKVSKRIQGQFKGNTKALAMQVMKAKQLGLSLDQIDKMGRQSLDIESSIGAEMEARVLTGKDINLNAFRLAALHKDQAGMMNEIQKYAGNAAEYSSMDYIQQEALAKAFGMSSDEMADMLQKKEMYNKLGVKSLDELSEQQIRQSNLTDDQKKSLEQELLRATAQERMVKAQEAMAEALKQVSTILTPIINGFTTLLSNSKVLKGVLVGLGVVLAGIAIAAIASASALTLGIGAAAIAAGIVAASFAADEATSKAQENAKKVDDSVMSPLGPSGYSRVLSGPKGSVAINDQDTVVSGTNLKGGAGAGNAEVVVLLKELIKKVDQPVQFVIGGKVINELDRTFAIKKSYTGKVDQGYGAFG